MNSEPLSRWKEPIAEEVQVATGQVHGDVMQGLPEMQEAAEGCDEYGPADANCNRQTDVAAEDGEASAAGVFCSPGRRTIPTHLRGQAVPY